MGKPPTPEPGTKKDGARALAVEAARIAEDSNAEEIVVLDLRGISPVAEYFVICTGTSGRQMRTVAEEIMAYGKDIGQKVYKVAGMDSSVWVIADFVDVVVHIFGEDHRRYYDLELIWGASPRVQWEREGQLP